jgi:hypothetical protein
MASDTGQVLTIQKVIAFCMATYIILNSLILMLILAMPFALCLHTIPAEINPELCTLCYCLYARQIC